MRIASVVQDSIVDGCGLRAAVFVQGCSHGCPGCHNPQTHDPDGGRTQSPEALAALLAQNPLLDGLTLTGGEGEESTLAIEGSPAVYGNLMIIGTTGKDAGGVYCIKIE